MKTLLLMALLAFPGKLYPSRFIDCYDGDTCTFDVVINDETQDLPFNLSQRITLTRTNQHVRLCDINAPEMKGPDAQAAQRARQDLLQWIKSAKTLELYVAQRTVCDDDSCDKTEKYGRALGWIVADGVNLNALQVQKGNAAPYLCCPGSLECKKQ